jgi:hypothetical protein
MAPAQCWCVLARESVQDFAGSRKVGEAFLFRTKFRGVREQGTAGAARGVLYMQHLVKQDVLDGILGNIRPVHAAIQQDLIRPWIKTSELPPPSAGTPSNIGSLQFA